MTTQEVAKSSSTRCNYLALAPRRRLTPHKRLPKRDWLARSEAIEHVRTKVYAVGPHNGSGFRFDFDAPEECQILERRKNAASAGDPGLEIDLALYAIAKAQA